MGVWSEAESDSQASVTTPTKSYAKLSAAR